MAKFDYCNGDTLTTEEYQKYFQHCLSSAIYSIERWGHNSNKIRERLTYRKHVPDLVYVDGVDHCIPDEVVSYLQGQGLINDEEMLKNLVASTLLHNTNKSINKIRNELINRKRFDADSVNKAIDDFCYDNEIDLDDREQKIALTKARNAIKDNAAKYRNKTSRQITAAITTKLANQYFNWHLAQSVAHELAHEIAEISSDATT